MHSITFSFVLILVQAFCSLEAKVPYEPRCHSNGDCSIIGYCCQYGSQSQWSSCCLDDQNCCSHGCSFFDCKEEETKEDTCAYLGGEWVGSQQWNGGDWGICTADVRMTVEDMSGGAHILFIMTRHPSNNCNCQHYSGDRCNSIEHTWLGSCSGGLITMTIELSGSNERHGLKGPCTGAVNSNTLFFQCNSGLTEKYNKA